MSSIEKVIQFFVGKYVIKNQTIVIMFQRSQLLFSLLFVLFFNSCIKESFDDALGGSNSNDVEEELMDNGLLELTSLVIPENFDFATQQQVTVSIRDTRSNVRYDVYAYNDELIEGEIVSYENQEGQMITGPEYRTDILNQLLFSGVVVNGILEHQIVLPTYYTQLYIRSKTNNTYSSEMIEITQGIANFAYTGAISTSG